MRRLEFYAEDPKKPKHILVVYPGDRTSVGLKVFGDIITIGNDCYESETGRLRHVIESLPPAERESLRRKGKPCFKDGN